MQTVCGCVGYIKTVIWETFFIICVCVCVCVCVYAYGGCVYVCVCVWRMHVVDVCVCGGCVYVCGWVCVLLVCACVHMFLLLTCRENLYFICSLILNCLLTKAMWLRQSHHLAALCPQNRDGLVTKKEFRQIVERFTFRLEDAQFKELMSQLKLAQGSRVSYHDFLDLFEQKESLKVL